MVNEKTSYEKPIIEIIEFLSEETIAMNASEFGVGFYDENREEY